MYKRNAGFLGIRRPGDAEEADDGDGFPDPATTESDVPGSLPGDRVRPAPYGRGSTSRRRWVGLPERRSRALPVLLAVTTGLGAAAGFAAERFVSPAQVAASASPPAPSLITTRVRFGVLPAIVQFRADVSTGRTVIVGAPSYLGGSLPVVTSVTVRAGQRVGAGQLIATVAQRPVFVFAGVIPAFRAMSPGMTGPDIRQLQTGLAAAGFGTGADTPGAYGAGTAGAVAALYRANGVRPVTTPQSGLVAGLSRQVTEAGAKLAAARAKLAADRRSRVPPRALATDTTAVGAAKAALAAAQRALATARRLAGATVPLGEVAFVPRLPARVVSVATLGATVGSGGAGPRSGSSPVAELATGQVTLTAPVAPAQAGLLRRGMRAIALSDVTGTEFGVQVSAVHGSKAIFVPEGRLPTGMGGQNVLVTVTTAQVRSLIVPVAAVSTSGSGQTFVTVSRAGGTVIVPVRLGLTSGGEQAVSPVRPGGLRPGDLVVLGIGVAGGG